MADDQWREVFLMVASMVDDGRFLVDALFAVLKEFPIKNPAIHRFLEDLLSVRFATKSQKYGGHRPATVNDELTGDQQYIFECCITIAGNMSSLHLADRYVAVPRLIAAGLRSDQKSVARNFGTDAASLRQVRAYFRLAALVSDCLTLATLPNRESYLEQLFSKSPGAILPS